MDRIKILPVYPEFPETFWGFKTALRYIGKRASMPPTGLLTVAGMLPDDQFEVQKVADLNVSPLRDEQLENTDIIFTSSMVIQENSHNEVIERAHEHGKKVVAGGPFPTSYPERNAGADYIVAGEAELTLAPFLEDLVKGNAQRMYTERSVAGRTRVELSVGGKPTLSSTPIPRWDLVDLKNYASASIQYSRGCPFNCEFCDITKLFGKEPRTKTPEQMVKEFNAIFDRGYRGSVMIVDDNFIGNRADVRALLPRITGWQKANGFPFQLFTEASMNLGWDSNEDIREAMVEAGFNSVFLGIETDDENSLAKMGKVQNMKMPALEAVRNIQRAGLEVTGGFIIGCDGEKPGTAKRLYNFIQEAGILISMVGLLVPIKGTRLYERLEKEGRLREDSQGNNTHHLAFSFIPEQDERTLIKDYTQLLVDLFLRPKNYYARARVLQENLGQNPQSGRTNLEGVLAFARSLKNQIFARGGLEYVKYLAETAVKNPRYFPEAVAQAIKLDHFGNITKEMLRADAYIPHTERLYKQFLEKAQKMSERYEKNVREAGRAVSEVAHRIIKRAEKKYYKLHRDFREGAEKALENLRERIQAEILRYNPSQVAGR